MYDRNVWVRSVLGRQKKPETSWDITFHVVILIMDAAVLGLMILNVGRDPKNWILVCLWGLIVMIQLFWLARIIAKFFRQKQESRLDRTSTLNPN